MIHIMFGAYTVMWVEACSELIKTQAPDNIFGTIFDFQHQIKFYLAVSTFLSLTCLWWWYTRVFFKLPIFRYSAMSIWDLVLLAVFALAYHSWSGPYNIFGVIFFSALMLLMIRFVITLICMRQEQSSPELVALRIGTICLAFIVLGFMIFWGGAILGTDGGVLSAFTARCSLPIFVTLCIFSTIAAALGAFFSARKLQISPPPENKLGDQGVSRVRKSEAQRLGNLATKAKNSERPSAL